jgi:hypothetical protein
MIDKASIHTFVHEKASQDLERYISTGRRFRSLDDAVLMDRMCQALEELARDPSIPEHWTAVTELNCEAELRGVSAPIEAFEKAMDKLSDGMVEATSRLQSDPVALAEANKRLLADIQAANDRINAAIKH